MKLKEPDLAGWNEYDPDKPPEASRRVVLRRRGMGVPMYDVLNIVRQSDGYSSSALGLVFWNKFRDEGTHWVYLDELVKASPGGTNYNEAEEKVE